MKDSVYKMSQESEERRKEGLDILGKGRTQIVGVGNNEDGQGGYMRGAVYPDGR